MTPQPMQPIVLVECIARFQNNAIVRFLLDWSSSRGMDLNDLSRMNFSDEDRSQFAQLIGYSVSGYGDLEYSLHVDIADARVNELLYEE